MLVVLQGLRTKDEVLGFFIFDERLVHYECHSSFDLEESFGTELMSHFFPFCFVFGPVGLQPCAISGCHYCIGARFVAKQIGVERYWGRMLVHFDQVDVM